MTDIFNWTTIINEKVKNVKKMVKKIFIVKKVFPRLNFIIVRSYWM